MTEPQTHVKYIGGDSRVVRFSVNGREYDLDEKGVAFLPLGDATALVTGDVRAWEFVSDKRQDDIEDNLKSETVPASDEGGRALQSNIVKPNPNRPKT